SDPAGPGGQTPLFPGQSGERGLLSRNHFHEDPLKQGEVFCSVAFHQAIALIQTYDSLRLRRQGPRAGRSKRHYPGLRNPESRAFATNESPKASKLYSNWLVARSVGDTSIGHFMTRSK